MGAICICALFCGLPGQVTKHAPSLETPETLNIATPVSVSRVGKEQARLDGHDLGPSCHFQAIQTLGKTLFFLLDNLQHPSVFGINANRVYLVLITWKNYRHPGCNTMEYACAARTLISCMSEGGVAHAVRYNARLLKPQLQTYMYLSSLKWICIVTRDDWPQNSADACTTAGLALYAKPAATYSCGACLGARAAFSAMPDVPKRVRSTPITSSTATPWSSPNPFTCMTDLSYLGDSASVMTALPGMSLPPIESHPADKDGALRLDWCHFAYFARPILRPPQRLEEDERVVEQVGGHEGCALADHVVVDISALADTKLEKTLPTCPYPTLPRIKPYHIP